MANEYGRGGVAVGGKGGTGLSSTYEFGPKAAGEYLTGGLAGEYAQASKILREDLKPRGYGQASQAAAKKSAKSKIGKLRDIAGAQAVGEFIGAASRMGRSSQAKASQGLLTGESYTPENMEGFTKAATTNYQVVDSRPLAGAIGAPAGGMKQAIENLATTEYGASKPIGYAGAALGTTGAPGLYKKFKAEETIVNAARAGIPGGPAAFASAAEERVPQVLAGRGNRRINKYRAAKRATAVEAERQNILGMTPSERYFQDISSY